ncbi:response regulator transcription factor [Mucilaginibacter achroorhodeus]|uniref:Response regulator transcription factor n=1 Tax=Mucilaginibacter achroorhodeus TaxID=2599294 RepID=A0A563TZX9_9SPHI|nr:response regulator transcription factor [Mucilaginibacter achroorhodeus]TWR24945.1 response regulator transcription factor [Mucilaginibacter achroorhodeus]
MKILVIEDEPGLRDDISAYLNADGNLCESCEDLTTATQKLAIYTYDFVLLDIGLPDGEGFAILDYLRTNNRSEAVLVISARNSLDDKLKGLNIGADDYLTKPFHLAELKARLMAVYRRKSLNTNNRTLVFNEINIDLHSREVIINDEPVILTKKEYDMLLYFLANKNKVIAKTAIAEHLWGDEMDMHDNFDFIYTHIKNLRKKMVDTGCNDYIKSVYGIGYKFTVS